MPPSAPKSACSVSPLLANTTRVNEPASTRWPGSSATPWLPSLLASQATPERRMAEHAGGDAGLLDLGILVHDAADPAQVDVQRADRPAADHDAGGGAVVRDRVEDLARVLQARIDDLDRRHDIFGRAQHVGQADARALAAACP